MHITYGWLDDKAILFEPSITRSRVFLRSSRATLRYAHSVQTRLNSTVSPSSFARDAGSIFWQREDAPNLPPSTFCATMSAFPDFPLPFFTLVRIRIHGYRSLCENQRMRGLLSQANLRKLISHTRYLMA